MYFDLGRFEGFPSNYGSNRTPVTVDVLEVGLIIAAVILALSFYLSMATSRALESVYLYIRITISILIGTMILLGNYGQEWEVAHIKSRTPYKAGSGIEINATIGVKIGLRSVNITLHSNSPPELRQEKIDYNERFEWTWDQGRFGFGPYSGQLQQEFRAAQYRGVPLPILWIADYFVIDGEGFRYGRFYRTAGWYAHIALWCAFPCWILANILCRSVIRYGGYCCGLVGFFQLLANLLWISIRNPHHLVIPFEDATIQLKYGSSFWLTFASGILSISISIAIVICDAFWNYHLCNFFGVSVIKGTEEKYLTYEELQEEYMKDSKQYDTMDEMLLRPKRDKKVPRNNSFVVRVKRNTKKIIKPPIKNHTTTDWDNVRQTYMGAKLHIQRTPMDEEAEDSRDTYDFVNTSATHTNAMKENVETGSFSRKPPPPPPKKLRAN